MNKYSQFIGGKPIFSNERLLNIFSNLIENNGNVIYNEDFDNIKEEILKRMTCFEYTLYKGRTVLIDELQ